MTTYIKIFLLSLCLSLLSVSTQAKDDTFLVDQADTTNFEDFHAEDPEKDSRSLKEYIFGEEQSVSQTPQMAFPHIPPEDRIIASSLLNTNQPSESINSLYASMLKNCPDGFIKLREWTQRDVSQGAMILQFEYTCQ